MAQRLCFFLVSCLVLTQLLPAWAGQQYSGHVSVETSELACLLRHTMHTTSVRLLCPPSAASRVCPLRCPCAQGTFSPGQDGSWACDGKTPAAADVPHVAINAVQFGGGSACGKCIVVSALPLDMCRASCPGVASSDDQAPNIAGCTRHGGEHALHLSLSPWQHC